MVFNRRRATSLARTWPGDTEKGRGKGEDNNDDESNGGPEAGVAAVLCLATKAAVQCLVFARLLTGKTRS